MEAEAEGGGSVTEYTGNYFTIKDSNVFGGQDVNVLEITSDSEHEKCFMCGTKLHKRWWLVQTAEDDLEICAVGIKCIKKLN